MPTLESVPLHRLHSQLLKDAHAFYVHFEIAKTRLYALLSLICEEKLTNPGLLSLLSEFWTVLSQTPFHTASNLKSSTSDSSIRKLTCSRINSKRCCSRFGRGVPDETFGHPPRSCSSASLHLRKLRRLIFHTYY